MSDLAKFQEELNRKKIKNGIYEILKDTFSLGVKEFSKTLSKNFSTPMSGDNQVTLGLEKWEETVISEKK